MRNRYVQIIPSAKGISGAIKSQLDPEASSAGISAGSTLGSKFVSIVKGVIATAAIGKVSAADLIKLTDKPLEIDKLRQGTVVMINTNEYGSFNLRIKKESKSDVFGAPQSIQLELGNLKDDINTTMSDLSRRQQINETYSQGATNILNYSYQDNCESSYPAEIEFYLDDDVFHVNTVELTFKTKRYRGYTKAVKGGGAKTITSEAGGQSTQTSSAGGGSRQTSSSGGGSVQSTTAGGGGVTTSGSGGGSYQGSSTSVGGGSTQTSSANGTHRHMMFESVNGSGPIQTTRYKAYGSSLLQMEGSAGKIYTAEASTNHTHTVSIPNHSHNFTINVPAHTHNVSIPSHAHNVNIPNHTHSVNIPNHTHTVKIPSHKHNVVLPEHNHPLEWGIFQANDSASSVDIIVDGKTIPHHETSQNRLNLVDYLKKTSSGKIQRGSHKIQIKPNKLARIEAQVTCRVFIQSQLGGQF